MPDPTTPQQVTEKARELLKDNRGLFIGENHDNPMAKDFMLSNMQALKESGVTTLYIEFNMYKTEAMKGGKEGRDAYMGEKGGPEWKPSNMQVVIEAATAAGLRVIGHDDITGKAAQWDRIYDSKQTADAIAWGDDAMNRRDDYAAALIEKTYDGGKFIVYGGAGHSGNDFGTQPGRQGLDNRLKIPSIDFTTPQYYYGRESDEVAGADMEKDLNEVMADRPPLVHMKEGVGGESTYKVTTADDEAFAKNIPQRTPEEQAQLDKIAALSKTYGLDKLPVRLEGKEVLDKTDIENLAARYAPAQEKQQTQAQGTGR